FRPIASGRLSRRTASVAGALLLAGALAAALRIKVPLRLVAPPPRGLPPPDSLWVQHPLIPPLPPLAARVLFRAVAGPGAGGAGRCGAPGLAPDLPHSPRPLPPPRQAAPRVPFARPRRVVAPAHPRRVQRGLPRSDDLRGHRLHRHRLCALHDVAGDGGQVPHAAASPDPAFRALRDLPVPLSALSA